MDNEMKQLKDRELKEVVGGGYEDHEVLCLPVMVDHGKYEETIITAKCDLINLMVFFMEEGLEIAVGRWDSLKKGEVWTVPHEKGSSKYILRCMSVENNQVYTIDISGSVF